MKKTPLILLLTLGLATMASAQDTDVDHTDHDSDQQHNALVSIGHDSNLASGEHAEAVVSVFGSSTSAGEVEQAVVSVLGDTHVTGSVGEAAVAVLGNTYVDGQVKGAVVAVLGNVELGPHADVGGDVVAVGGSLLRDPAAIVHGGVQNVALFGVGGGLKWLHSWVQHCLLYGRPLALAPGLEWAWVLALSFLSLYLFIALLFPRGVEQCVHTMEEQPGRCVVAGILTLLLKPILLVLILVTVIGVVLLPFLWLALFIAGLFGNAVVLAWIGRRVLPAQAGEPARTVLTVLAGGVVVLLLYLVPIIGFIVYKGVSILGLGIVVYTLLQSSRSSRAARAANLGATAAGATLAADPGSSSAPAPESPAESAATPEPASTPSPAPAPAATPAPPPPLPSTAERAGFWIRIAALVIDLVMVSIVCGMLDVSFHGMLLVLAGYGAVMWKLKGTTVGGAICHLRLVRLDGRAIDWPTAVVRALACFLSAAVAGLGFLWVVFDPERQSWHDKIAGTVVVCVPKGAPLV